MLEPCNKITWNGFNEYLLPNSLSVACMNARSLKARYHDLVSHLNILVNCFSFIIITESWLLSKDDDLGFDIEGYKSISVYRGRKGGGIKMYYLNSISANIIDNLTVNSPSCETLFINAKVPSCEKIIIGGVYRPPNSLHYDFLSIMENSLSSINNTRSIVTGDFNYNILDPNDYTNDYMDLMSSYGFSNCITLETYVSQVTNQDKSCLDHIWTNTSIEQKNFVIYPNLSDHYCVATVFSISIDCIPIQIKFRDFCDRNCQNFSQNLPSEFSSFNPPMHDIDLFTGYSAEFLTNLLNKYFPVKTKVYTQKRLRSPWITGDVMNCINKKHEWYRLMKENIISYDSYKRYSYLVRKILRLAEENYYVHRLDSLGSDPKKNFAILNKLLGKNKTKEISDHFVIEGVDIDDPKLISDKFNEYFVEHPIRIHENIPPSRLSYFNLIQQNETVAFAPTDPNEISAIILSMKKNSKLNDIPTNFLKLCSPNFSPFLASLFNLCLIEKKFPSKFKIAEITPIHKKGSKIEIKNHRPISVLPNLSKNFEHLIFNRVKSIIDSFGVLSENQFGFRKHKNTELAALTLINRSLPAIEHKKYAICVFLDFSACFDTIDRNIFSQKLLLYGFHNDSVEFIDSYFSGRKQHVKFNGQTSKTILQNLGVIQGSKNGPLFFDIYSNDLNQLCSQNQIIQFADDTCLVYLGDDLSSLEQHVNTLLSGILDWCRFNKLSINPSKSEYIIVTNKTLEFEPRIVLGNDIICRRNSVKYLGLHIDDKLKFPDHVTHLKSKLASLAGISFRLQKRFNLRTAKNYYYSMVFSTITYCISAWGGALLNCRRGEPIIKYQKKIIQNLFSKHQMSNSCLFQEFKILKVVDVYKLYCSIHMYKILVTNSNPHLQNSIDVQYPAHSYDTRNANRILTPFPRVDAMRYNFNYQFINIWNTIPISIRESASLKIFKRRYSEYLLSLY